MGEMKRVAVVQMEEGDEVAPGREERRDPYDFSDIPLPEEALADTPQTVSLEQLLGGYSPVEGHPELFYKKPKLGQKLEMAQSLEGAETLGDVAAARVMVEVVAICCYVREAGRMRRAKAQDLLEILDGPEEVGQIVEALGFRRLEGAEGNA